MNARAWFYRNSFHSSGLTLQDHDFTREVPNEKYSCGNCHRRGPLNENGKCGSCGSDAVISLAIVEGSHAERT